MHYENLGIQGVEMFQVVEGSQRAQEIIKSHEAFYKPISLYEKPIVCSDDRTPGLYVKWFGGVLNPVYNILVMQESDSPGSVNTTFEIATGEIVPDLEKEAGIKPAVHSDTQAEHSDHIRTDVIDGPVGCRYAEKRQAISGLILSLGEEILEEAQTMSPELFKTAADFQIGRSTIAAHGRLANRHTFYTSGRKVILRAIKNGASSIVVGGPHASEEGIINLVRNTALDGSEANAANLPVYDVAAWASNETFGKVQHIYQFTSKQNEIATLIDSIGTMKALGVNNIAVRRS